MPEATGLPPPADRKQLALEEILGRIAPRVLTIMNAACFYKDLEELRAEMGKLHEHINELAVLFASEPETQKHISDIGQLGGGALSLAPSVPLEVFKRFTEATDALTRVLAEMQARRDEDASLAKVSGAVRPIVLPSNTKWEDITIEFLDGDNVRISVKDIAWETDFKQMGFEKGRSKPRVPNKQWSLLEDLAENHGQVSWDDGRADLKVKKRKHLLSKSLRDYFRISGDPFYSYRTVKAYKIRIKLIPS